MRLLVHPMLSNIVSNDVENCTTIDLVVAFWCYSASEQIFSGIQNIYLSLVSWMEIPQVNLFELFHSFYSQHHHMYSKLISFIIFISVAVAVPTISVQNQSCNSKSIHCCNQVHSSKSSMIQNQLENTSGFFGHFFGLGCVPAAGQGAAGNNWLVVRLIYK